MHDGVGSIRYTFRQHTFVKHLRADFYLTHPSGVSRNPLASRCHSQFRWVWWDGWDGRFGREIFKSGVIVNNNNIKHIGCIESVVLVIRDYFYLFHILLTSDLLFLTFALRVSFLNLQKYVSSKSIQYVVTMVSPSYYFFNFFSLTNGHHIPSHHIYWIWLRHLLGSKFLESLKVWVKWKPAQVLHVSFVMWCDGRPVRDFLKIWCDSLATVRNSIRQRQPNASRVMCSESELISSLKHFVSTRLWWSNGADFYLTESFGGSRNSVASKCHKQVRWMWCDVCFVRE